MNKDRRKHIESIFHGAFACVSQTPRWTASSLVAVVLPAHAQTSCGVIEAVRTIEFTGASISLPVMLDFEFIGDGCNTSIVSPGTVTTDVEVSFTNTLGVGVYTATITYEGIQTELTLVSGRQTQTANMGVYVSPSGESFRVLCVVTFDEFSDPAFAQARLILEST